MADLVPYLDAAAVHPDFRRDVLAYIVGDNAARIELAGHAPRVKVERVLTQLLCTRPDLQIERIALRAQSGCSDFTGELAAFTPSGEYRFMFTWCCAWRAEQQEWRDCFGFWDQQRAAREFGWDCFKTWTSLKAPVLHI